MVVSPEILLVLVDDDALLTICKRIDEELEVGRILHLECTCHWPSAPDGHLFLLSNPEEYGDRSYLIPAQRAPAICPA